jgi:hypothetical protein
VGLHLADIMGAMNPLVVDVLGRAVEVKAPVPLLDQIRSVLVDLERREEPARTIELVERPGGLSLYDGDELVRADIAPSLGAATVVWRLNSIAATSHNLIIHAGCVAGTGGVILPGESGVGKSTLTAACVEVGMDYLCDEFAALDLATGALVGYPKPIGFAHETLVSASTLRSGSIRASCHPVAVVFPLFTAGAALSVAKIDPRSTLLALAQQTTNLATSGRSILPWLAGLAASCPAWQVSYGDARAAVPIIEDAGSAPSEPVVPAQVLDPITDTTTTVVLGDELVVFDELTRQLHILSESAALVWRWASNVKDPGERVDSVLALAPDGAIDRRAVIATIERLEALGLVT